MWLLTYVPLSYAITRPKVTVWLCVGMIMLGCAMSGIVTWWFDFPAVIAGREFEIYKLIANK